MFPRVGPESALHIFDLIAQQMTFFLTQRFPDGVIRALAPEDAHGQQKRHRRTGQIDVTHVNHHDCPNLPIIERHPFVEHSAQQF